MSFELLPSETEIVGSWVIDGKNVEADSNERRIEWLLKHSLEKAAQDWSGWKSLYRNLHDQRFWELTFPQGEVQGGGPRKLTCLSEAETIAKYSFSQRQELATEKQNG